MQEAVHRLSAGCMALPCASTSTSSMQGGSVVPNSTRSTGAGLSSLSNSRYRHVTSAVRVDYSTSTRRRLTHPPRAACPHPHRLHAAASRTGPPLYARALDSHVPAPSSSAPSHTRRHTLHTLTTLYTLYTLTTPHLMRCTRVLYTHACYSTARAVCVRTMRTHARTRSEPRTHTRH